jgi:rare lipoprotein A
MSERMINQCRVTFWAVTLLSSISLQSPLLASTETGIASVYSGERTANGEYAHAHALTAAHRTLPFGTKVKVTNLVTGRSVVVRINDRGPYIKGRIIDLTPAGAKAIGSSGLARVQVAVVSGRSA